MPADELKKPERHKSAPPLRLKNSKRTSKCQVLSSTVPELEKNPNFFRNFFEVSGKSHSAEKCKRGAFGIFEKKLKGDPLETLQKFAKKSQNRNNMRNFWSKNPNEPLCQVPVEVVWHLALVQASL